MTEQIEQIVDLHKDRRGPLLPILHAIKDTVGHIPAESIPVIARKLNLSRAEVHGVISFYHDFNIEPVGDNVVQICRAEACQSMGSRELENHAKKVLGLDYGDTSADGSITLEPVYCLGNCSCSPSIAINRKVYAEVDAVRFDELIAKLGNTAGEGAA